MKKTLYAVCLLLALAIPVSLRAQILGVQVEKYYVSDYLDETHLVNGTSLPIGSKTYRIFIDLKEGSKIRKIYGDAHHPLMIKSTADFFNNTDRPTAYFGYLINKSWFYDNPTLALDSWLTLGLGTKTQMAVLKSVDSDGTVVGGVNNGGGSASINGGLLVNNDPSIGVPLTQQDGLVTNNQVMGQWLDYGFKDAANEDTTVFGSIQSGSYFYSTTAFLQQNNGIAASSTYDNKVLVAQLTTTGEIEFELNLEVEITDGSGTRTVKYVASADTLLSDEILSPYLKYPQVCGCTDPQYIEYNAKFACSILDSCKTRVKHGCTDPAACNFDPDANYSLPALCCYPGYCNDRDLAVVCPELVQQFKVSDAFPNPANDMIHVKVNMVTAGDCLFEIYNSFGKVVHREWITLSTGEYTYSVHTQELDQNVYVIKVTEGTNSVQKVFVKQ